MNLDLKPASGYPLTELTQLLNLSFEEYLVPVNLNLVQFLTMLRKDSIDLFSSRVLLMDEELSGIALIARRGWNSRLAAMGILQSKRGLGAGRWLLEKLIQEARDREEHEILLEVIEQNEYAVRLYRRCGFQSIRRLIGMVCEHAGERSAHPLEEIDLREAGRLISQHGLPDLPWQLAGETIAHLTPPARAYRNGQTYVVTSDPQAEHVVIWSLLVEPAARGNRFGIDMLQNVMANYPGKIWHVPAIFPEELGSIFEMAGFEREDISQWQMRLVL